MADTPDVRVIPNALHPAEGSIIAQDITSAALIDRASEEADAKEGTVAPELVTPSEAPAFGDLTTKSSSVVDLL